MAWRGKVIKASVNLKTGRFDNTGSAVIINSVSKAALLD